MHKTVDLQAIVRDSNVTEVLDQLDRELVGLAPVKRRIREIAAYLAVTRARKALGLEAAAAQPAHVLHRQPRHRQDARWRMRMAEILHRLGYVRKGHLVAVTRDDLVGQYIGHTAPKTKEVLKKAMGGVLFIDEAYYLYRPENERDYGQESIEILLQVMENNRDDLVVILAGYKDRMNTFFSSNPGMSSRIAHHIDFPDYAAAGTAARIAQPHGRCRMNYQLGDGAAQAAFEPLPATAVPPQPHFANARSACATRWTVRGLRQASRLFADRHKALSRDDLTTLSADDIHGSRRVSSADADPGHASDILRSGAGTHGRHRTRPRLADFNTALAQAGFDWHWDCAL